MSAVMVEKPVRTVALWRTAAQQVEHPPAGSLSIRQVSDQTGLSPKTIWSAMQSRAHTGERARLKEISRPRYEVGGIPYWEPDQVADYIRKLEDGSSVLKEFGDLPTITIDNAVEIEATSLNGLSILSTVPKPTLHRWKLMAGFPRPIAFMDVDSPTPRLLYHWPTVRKHLLDCHSDWFEERADSKLDLARIRVTRDTV